MAINKLVLAACGVCARQFGRPGTVYYPACGNDSSPSQAFPNATVMYLDPVQRGLDEIKREQAGAITSCARAEDATLTMQYDLVVLTHPQAPLDAAIRDLKRGGHLLIVNRTSDRAFDSPHLELAGAMQGTDSNLRIDPTDLDKYHEIDPAAKAGGLTNRRRIKAPFYVFKKK